MPGDRIVQIDDTPDLSDNEKAVEKYPTPSKKKREECIKYNGG